ncbi:unnamed protein product [Fraxinus pennsylvanica]|uniref:Uncharacterized protein n=1 Tax=Fraxinus pennsylvanica TaxID=56036 RepID=A0AAD2AC87_9LAMI|nr:unnamed protein product [Fraxinus pennsylvanica]
MARRIYSVLIAHRIGLLMYLLLKGLVILVYSLIYHMMEPPVENYEIAGEEDEKHEQLASDEASKSLLVEVEWPGIEDEEIENSKTPLIYRIFKTLSSVFAICFALYRAHSRRKREQSQSYSVFGNA